MNIKSGGESFVLCKRRLMMKKWLFIFTGLLIILSHYIFADTIILKTGESRVGKVSQSKSDPDNILFESSVGEMRIPRTRIARIDKETDDASYMHIAQDFFQSKNYSKATGYAEKALKVNPQNKDAQKLIEDIQQAIREEAKRRSIEHAQEIDISLSNIGKLIDNKKLDEALDLMNQTERLTLSEQQKKTATSLKGRLYYQLGLLRIDQMNPRGAAEYFEKALAIQPDNQEVFNQLIAIWKNDPAMTSKLISIYEKRYEAGPGNLEVARTLTDLYFKERDMVRALPYLIILKHGTKVPDPVTDDRLRQALTALHGNATAERKFDKAADYYKTFLEFFPNEDPTPLYYDQYSSQLATLGANDLNGHIKLGDFCKAHNLDEDAKERYFYVLGLDPKNEKALAGLTYYASQDLAEAQDAFDRKEYDTTIYVVGQIASSYAKLPDILAKAYELKERAENELRKEAREKNARALALARRGDEFYATAESHINALMSTERRSSSFIISDKEEAKKFLNRAIDTWEAALQIDPTLATRESEDLDTKLKDARARLMALYRVIPLPKIENYPYNK